MISRSPLAALLADRNFPQPMLLPLPCRKGSGRDTRDGRFGMR
jgi:hypothetical protein